MKTNIVVGNERTFLAGAKNASGFADNGLGNVRLSEYIIASGSRNMLWEKD